MRTWRSPCGFSRRRRTACEGAPDPGTSRGRGVDRGGEGRRKAWNQRPAPTSAHRGTVCGVLTRASSVMWAHHHHHRHAGFWACDTGASSVIHSELCLSTRAT